MNQFLGAVSQVLGRKCRKIVLTFSFSNAVGCHPKATSMLKPPVPGLPGSPLGFFLHFERCIGHDEFNDERRSFKPGTFGGGRLKFACGGLPFERIWLGEMFLS